MSTPVLSTAMITVTPLVDGQALPAVTREIGADLAACDLGGPIGECVSALFHVGVLPHQIEFRVKIEPSYWDKAETN